MAKVGKKELVKKVAEELNLPQKEVQSIIEKTLETIVKEVKSGNEVTIIGFGTFKEKINKEKEGINPQTREKMIIPGSKTIAFKASCELPRPKRAKLPAS